MKLTITMDLDNAAFLNNPHELLRVLRKLSGQLIVGITAQRGLKVDDGLLEDLNGNTVGEWRVTA